MGECAEWEHADAGIDNPPPPREIPPSKDATEGWRRDTPPEPVWSPPPQPHP